MSGNVIIATDNVDRRISAETADKFGITFGDLVPVGERLLAVIRDDIERKRAAKAIDDPANDA